MRALELPAAVKSGPLPLAGRETVKKQCPDAGRQRNCGAGWERSHQSTHVSAAVAAAPPTAALLANTCATAQVLTSSDVNGTGRLVIPKVSPGRCRCTACRLPGGPSSCFAAALASVCAEPGGGALPLSGAAAGHGDEPDGHRGQPAQLPLPLLGEQPEQVGRGQ